MTSLVSPRALPLPPSGDGRVAAFDSLRGIAALIVVLHHLALSLTLPDDAPLRALLDHTPLHLLVAGRASVMLFFILSGFALAALASRTTSYPAYVVRRVVRIMLPFWVAILLSAILFLTLHPAPMPWVSDWMNAAMWSQPLSPKSLFHHLIMTGLAKDTFLSGIMWSLVYEMRISLAFPLIYWACRKAPRVTALISAAGFLGIGWFVAARQIPVYATDTAAQSVLLTFYYAPFFVMGCLLYLHRAAVTRRVAALPQLGAWALGGGALALLITEQDGLIGLGGGLILMLTLGRAQLANVLQAPPLAWLGRISYSLYLTHLLVMACLFHALRSGEGTSGALLLAVPAALATAALFHAAVEAPATQLSRLWGRALAAPLPAAASASQQEI